MYYKLSDKLGFGKYKGLSIKDVINEDCTYIKWCVDNVADFELDVQASDYHEEAMEAHMETIIAID